MVPTALSSSTSSAWSTSSSGGGDLDGKVTCCEACEVLPDMGVEAQGPGPFEED